MKVARQTISVPKRFSWDSVEESFVELTNAKGHVDLKLTTHLRNLQFGGASVLLQLVTTWIRSEKCGDLYTYLGSGGGSADENLKSHVDDFLEHPHVLLAASHAEHIFDFENHDITDYVRSRARDYLSNNRKTIMPKSNKGLRFHFICEDLSGAVPTNEGMHPFFYDRGEAGFPKVRDTASLGRQIQAILAKQIREKLWTISPIIYEELGVIIHELFENTHVWARDDLDKNPIRPSYRGMLFNCHVDYLRTAETMAQEIGGNNQAVISYMRGCTRNDKRLRPLLEITVFDCGPTLPKRVGRDIYDKLLLANEAEEYEVAIKAFLLWTSSSPELNRGRGLERVLRAITKCKGFLLLRTSRLTLYRDLRSDPYTDASAWSTTIEPGKHPLRNFIQKSSKRKASSEAAGTFLTFLIPLIEGGEITP